MEQDHAATPPTEPGEITAPRKPPKWPLVVGTLSTIWAGLGITCAACGMIVMPTLVAGMIKDQLGGAPLPPGYRLDPIAIIFMAAGVMLAMILLGAGIATIRRNWAGRTLHLAWAVLQTLMVPVSVWYQLNLQSQMKQWAIDYPDNPIAKSMNTPGQSIGEAIGVAVGLALGLAWPVFCLIWFALVKRTRESMGADIERPEYL